MEIRIATRKSELALWQARHVADKLATLQAVDKVSLVPLSTRGDEILDRSLQKIGGKGLFIKELELAMLADKADIAVHSMKDVPAEMPDGFCLAATLARANPMDALVARERIEFAQLPRGATIGSSSLRRQAQLKALRPDLRVTPLRGNVNTRLAKLDQHDYDAIVLACAGLERLGFGDRITYQFSAAEMLPASAQGVIGIECRADIAPLRDILSLIEDPCSRRTCTAERAVAKTLDADCHSPVASFATVNGGHLSIEALVAAADGSTVLRRHCEGKPDDAAELGKSVAAALLEDGAGELLAKTAT